MFRKNLLLSIAISVLVSTGWAVHARELTDMNIQISSDKQGSEAKQEAFDKATAEATLKLTEEILTPERAAKYWSNLKPKLLKNSARYVIFIKGSPPEVSGGLTRINVQLRLSGDALEGLLREEGLLSSGTVRVLPVVQISEQNGTPYTWWAEKLEGGGPPEIFKKFMVQLATKFKARNAYVMDPLNPSFRLSVPSAYRTEVLRREDQALLAQYLKADVVVSGNVAVQKVKAEGSEVKLVFDLQIWQAKSGREIGAIQREEVVASLQPKVLLAALDQAGGKVVDELSAKLGEVLAMGGLNLNLIKLSVKGNLDFRQQTDFRKLLAGLREVKVLRERLFEPTRVIYEIETAASGQDLAKSVQQANFPAFAVEVEDSQDNSLALSVRASGASSVR